MGYRVGVKCGFPVENHVTGDFRNRVLREYDKQNKADFKRKKPAVRKRLVCDAWQSLAMRSVAFNYP
jgi:hypothetical protein